MAVKEERLSREEKRPARLAPEGSGPLMQRDYVLVVEGSRLAPEEVVRLIRSGFPRFSPAGLAEFTRPEGATSPLALDDTMHIKIRGAGHCAVVVSHLSERSMTLRTLQGHIESGRITFGAGLDVGGRLVLRIRSRARWSNPPRLLGYFLGGKMIQARVWITFLERLAAECGGRRLGDVVLSTDRVSDNAADAGEEERPTFTAAGS